MKYAIVVLILAAFAMATPALAKGFDGANAPGGQQVGGKWYNPNQSPNQGGGGGNNSGGQGNPTQGVGRVPPGGGTAPTSPTQVAPHSHQGCGCCCN